MTAIITRLAQPKLLYAKRCRKDAHAVSSLRRVPAIALMRLDLSCAPSAGRRGEQPGSDSGSSIASVWRIRAA